jgi:predicted RNA-binding Zn-ribbon protein involved in translation (DUF1610 family)
MMETADLLSRLKGVKPNGDNGWLALCPGHDDHEQSLSIKEVAGKILLNCFAGRKLEDILKALRLEIGDLFLNGNKAPEPKPQKTLVEMMASRASYGEKLGACRLAVSSFVNELFQKHGVKSVAWNRNGDSRELLRTIARFGNLVRRLRGTIATWGEGDHTPPIIEYPPRLVMLLYDLARGHAIVHGRQQLAREDIDLVVRVALSSMPDARRRVFRELMGEEVLETSDVMRILKVTRPTALKVMRTLGALGAVQIDEEKEDEATTKVEISLLPQDKWLLHEDFSTTDMPSHPQRRKILQPDVLQPNASVKEFDAVTVQYNVGQGGHTKENDTLNDFEAKNKGVDELPALTATNMPPSPHDDSSDYPAHPCPECGSEWAISPDGRQYLCPECGFLHPVDCQLCLSARSPK